MRYHSNKQLGQHYIKDPEIQAKVVSIAGDLTNFDVIEIGPGYGDLTSAIISANPRSLRCVEKDLKFHDYYASRFPADIFVFADAMTIDERSIADGPVKIIANLPFNVASQLLFKWLDNLDFFASITVMLQKEFAMRLCAAPHCKDYGRISVLFQAVCDIHYALDVSPEHFTPPPKVDSSVVNIVPLFKPKFDHASEELRNLTRLSFNQRRKQMQNIIRSFLQCDKGLAEELLSQVGIEGRQRPEDISVEQYCKLSMLLNKR